MKRPNTPRRAKGTELFRREAAQMPLDFSGERLTSAMSGEVAIEHYHRYFLARDFCTGKDVLDIAAGEGYGSALLAQVARSVVGVEIDTAVVEAARLEFQKRNLSYLTGDARAIPLPDASIDVAVSFETYEHFAEHEQFLAELKRVLRPRGLLIISTPDKDIYSGPGIPPNPYHVREVTEAEFSAALKTQFPNVTMIRQRALVGSFLDAGSDAGSTRHFETRGSFIEAGGQMARAPYVIAFASKAPLPPVPSSLFVEHSDIDSAARQLVIERELLVQAREEAARQLVIERDLRELLVQAREEAARQLVIERELLVQAREEIAEMKGLDMTLVSTREAFEGAAAELERLKASSSWKVSAPLRTFTERYPRAARRMAQAGKLAYWTATGQVVRRLKASVEYRFGPHAPDRAVADSNTTRPTPDGIPIFLDKYLTERWPSVSLATVKEAYRFATERNGVVIGDNALADSAVASMIGELTALAASAEKRAAGKGSAPAISIVVPVHNALAHTLACLKSVLVQDTAHGMEILVADDTSMDATAAAMTAIGGAVRLVKQPTNLGFVRNCNAAAAQARGQVIIFLNNDTVVLPGWLDELTAPLLIRRDVGLTCSKLLNADGTLQEAGGIFWNDGSAWNYGRGADPRAYPFNFVRDTDYGSGAAIAIPATLWRELGGFDDQFAPAYCEDADVAFAARAKGYKTLYIPTAEVIHHEGVSHGRDTSAGIKAYQVENLKKLKAKWAADLERHFPNGDNVAVAAARSWGKPRILVIDHYVPQPDRDAGSRAMDSYLRLLVTCGAHVTFWPDNRSVDRIYGPAYQALGIEMVYAWPGRLEFQEWIEKRGREFDHIIISRPHVATTVLPQIKKHSTAKLHFIGHDLHAERLRLERSVAASPELELEIRKAEAMETEVWNAVSTIYYPSADEARKVTETGVKAAVRALPLFAYSESEICAPLAGARLRNPSRPHVMFVGGFPHRPNVDGIAWFCREVWPLVQRELPDARLSIAGGSPPPAVTRFGSDSITITGHISDDALNRLYASADLVVAPLRFGAGVKGKVVEALLKGVPTVLTSVAAQGIRDVGSAAIIADDPEAFAAGVIEMLKPGEDRARRVSRGQEIVREQYSIDVVRAVLALDIPELKALSWLQKR
jgi:O-antigen biosynthesis protein